MYSCIASSFVTSMLSGALATKLANCWSCGHVSHNLANSGNCFLRLSTASGVSFFASLKNCLLKSNDN
ncbi:unnamed protein product [Haemonchus placei]|uniref:Secreted protein n=1 Tax=Haemonchus placei TaxID=6290 RepID=A0A0N4W2L2_HAEPC|nr:unnamed protein product [Haemonchus placei]